MLDLVFPYQNSSKLPVRLSMPDDIQPVPDEEVYLGDTYWENAFIYWYNAGKPSAVVLQRCLKPDAKGFMPSLALVQAYMRRNNWRERAKQMDLEVMNQMRSDAIKNRLNIMKKQADEARTLVQKGMDFLNSEKGGIDKAGDAIRAITEGWKKEFESLGADKILAQMSTWSNERLASFVAEQLESFGDDIPDQITSNTEEILDGEFEEPFPGEFDDESDLNAHNET